ncbi:MAG: hypothetical protein A2Y34_13225 [Spirochaetes bacterium GWC1_27_15]|nr:MAG: hypothetical protein A2Y34_13225 [Spirochaetes bacterium GWC1_27_15]
MRKIGIFFFILLVLACGNNNAFLFYNQKYVVIFPEIDKILYKTKERLDRDFYKIYKVKNDSFITINTDVDKITAKYKNGLLVLPDFLATAVIKNDNFASTTKGKNFKLLTNNIPEDYKFPVQLPIFNILVEPKVIIKELVSILKKHSKTKNFSDCGIVIDSNFTLVDKTILEFNKKNYNIKIFNILTDGPDVKTWIEKNTDFKIVIFFAYKYNNKILEMENFDKKKLVFAEVFTDYGNIIENVKYKINIDWGEVFYYGINSVDFKKFINSKKIENKIYNYLVKNQNVVYTKIYNIKKIKP